MKKMALLAGAGVLAVMLAATSWASLHQPIWEVGHEYWGNPWAVATLVDAYCGFLLFYLWVAYREQGAFPRVMWFVLIMLLGNMATAAYLLIQLAGWRPSDGAGALLLKKTLEA